MGRNLWRYFVAAIIFHILFSSFIVFIGRNELLPEMFNPQGLGSFASDSYGYMLDIEEFVDVLGEEGAAFFFTEPLDFHLKLYSISFILLRGISPFTILNAELFNVFCYALILVLAYSLGKDLFSKKVGLISAAVTGLWPSLLLHTTQLYKTPLIIACMLAIFLVSVRWYACQDNFSSAIRNEILGILAVMVLSFLRDNEWRYLIILAIALGWVGLLLKMRLEKKRVRWNMIASTLLLAISLVAPSITARFLSAVESYGVAAESPPQVAHPTSSLIPTPTSEPTLSPSPTLSPTITPTESSLPLPEPRSESERMSNYSIWDGIKDRLDYEAYWIGVRREYYNEYAVFEGAGSNVDSDYQIETLSDLLGYIPKGILVGFFAPFPNMWFEAGAKLGVSARLLSGLETLFMYLMTIAAVVAIWQSRRKYSIWYLFSVIFISLSIIGYFVGNIGALYRFRYPFWMMLIIFGVGGFYQVVLPYRRRLFARK